jgi:hypothetical protein
VADAKVTGHHQISVIGRTYRQIRLDLLELRLPSSGCE